MKIKTCPFFIDGPTYQKMQARNQSVALGGMYKLHTMQDWDNPRYQKPVDYVMLPRVAFQAEMQYVRLDNGRVLMNDVHGRQWSVFGAAADELLPKMQMGKITAWWIMAKKGQACGLMVDTSRPLMAHVPSNQDVPLMLEKSTDLNAIIPYLEDMVV